MRKIVGFFLTVLIAASSPCLAEEVTLKTILPRQDEMRFARGVVGDSVNNTPWDYKTVPLPGNCLIVGTGLAVGRSIPMAELHLKETGMGGPNNSPRIIMEDGDPANKPFMIEYDTEADGSAIEMYFPCDANLPSIGMFLRAQQDQTVRFMHRLIVNPVSTAGRKGSIAVGLNTANCRADVAGVVRARNGLQLTPVRLDAYYPGFLDGSGEFTDGMKHGLIACDRDYNVIKRYVPETNRWVNLGVTSWKYRGNGNPSQRIDLGFRPVAVQIMQITQLGGGPGPGASRFEKPLGLDQDHAFVTDGLTGRITTEDNIIQLEGNGFTVYNTRVGPGGVGPNNNNVWYTYIAHPQNGGDSAI